MHCDGGTILSVLNLVCVSARIFATGQIRRIRPRQYHGSPEAICRQIVEACYDSKKKYFRTSAQTYPELWSRDFGRCVPALIHTGYRDEVVNSYLFAFRAYQRAGRYELTVLPSGSLYNFPFGSYSPDGFAFFLYGLCALNEPGLVADNKHFLNREAARFFRTVVAPRNGTVKENIHFSEAQDYLRRSSSCYSTCCCFIVQQALNKLGLDNPLASYNYSEILKHRYFNPEGHFFYDDMHRRNYISGDANILPFWSGMVSKPGFADIMNVLEKMDESELNSPYPSRYRNGTEKLPSLRLDRVNPWQTDSVWTCLGLHLLEMLYIYHRERFQSELNKICELVSRLRCFPEVIHHRTKNLYQYPLYVSETSMLWAANLLNLLQERPRVVHEHM